MSTFTLRSADLGGQVTNPYLSNDPGVGGENLSPALSWDNAPANTRAFAITMYDPAAPTGSGWWHWVLFNLPADTRELATGAASSRPDLLPPGSVSSLNDFGRPGYGGPVPDQSGAFHPYLLTVYALSKPLSLDADTAPAMVGYQLSPVTLAKASLVAYLKV